IYVDIIYSALGLVQFNLFEFVIFRMLPTFILNFILLIILYPLITKFLKKIQLKIDSKRL
ncbi:rod shape-determining protein MreD, partial [Staphylococcus cohnii]